MEHSGDSTAMIGPASQKLGVEMESTTEETARLVREARTSGMGEGALVEATRDIVEGSEVLVRRGMRGVAATPFRSGRAVVMFVGRTEGTFVAPDEVDVLFAATGASRSRLAELPVERLGEPTAQHALEHLMKYIGEAASIMDDLAHPDKRPRARQKLAAFLRERPYDWVNVSSMLLHEFIMIGREFDDREPSAALTIADELKDLARDLRPGTSRGA